MPIYDYLGGTLERDSPDNKSGGWTSDRLMREARAVDQRERDTPHCVFLAHGTDLLSALHLPMALRSFASRPYESHWCLWPLWPLVAAAGALLWAFGSVFVSHVERLEGRPVQTWVVPRFGFQYFLGRREEGRINGLILAAIRDADRAGVKVFGLGALNKAEHLNGGGAVFPAALGPGLRTRVVHGNTLTAACLVKEIDVAKGGAVFVTGATSKLGRAVALHLCRKVRGPLVKPPVLQDPALRLRGPPPLRGLLRCQDGQGTRSYTAAVVQS